MLSGALAVPLSELMQLIMLRNIRIYCYLQSLQEIVGDMVSDE